MSVKFIIDTFVCPANHYSWLILFVFVPLLIGIPVIQLTIRKNNGYLLAFGLSFVPLLLGLMGTLTTYTIAKNAIAQVPEAQQVAAWAAGLGVALSSLFFGSLPTILLWCLSVIFFIVASKNHSDTPPARKKSGTLYPIGGITRWKMIVIGVSVVPLLIACSSAIYGNVLINDAIANVPPSVRGEAVNHGKSIVATALLAGGSISTIWITLSLLFIRKKEVKN
jgi:hypothetical protein